MSKELSLQRGSKLQIQDKLEVLLDIAEAMDSSNITKGWIKKTYGVTWITAGNWYNEAVLLRAKQDNGLTREGHRNIHLGQIDRRLNELMLQLEQWGGQMELKDKLAIHDRIVKYLDSRARITGLNSEVVHNTHTQLKPLNIVLSDQPTDTDSTHTPPS